MGYPLDWSNLRGGGSIRPLTDCTVEQLTPEDFRVTSPGGRDYRIFPCSCRSGHLAGVNVRTGKTPAMADTAFDRDRAGRLVAFAVIRHESSRLCCGQPNRNGSPCRMVAHTAVPDGHGRFTGRCKRHGR